MNGAYPSPNRVYHRGSSTLVMPTTDGTPQSLLHACPMPPRMEGFCEPAHGLILVCRVRLAPGVVDAATWDWSNAFLIVDYGSGDPDVQHAEYDVINGDGVPLVGGGVGNVNVYMSYARSVVQEVQVTPPIQVDISLAVSSSMGAPRRTVRVGNTVGGAESAIFPIPPYAVDAVLRTNDATAAATIKFYASPVAGATQIAVATVQKQTAQSVPVPQAARGFSMTTVADAVDVRGVFLLRTA